MSTERMPLGEWTLRVFVTLLTGVLFLALWELRDVFLLTFLAVIVAIVLQLPVRYLERMGLNRGLSIGVTMIVTLTVLGLLVVLIVPVFVQQVAELVNELPDLLDQAREEYDQQADHYGWVPEIDWDNVTEGSAQDFLINQAGDLSRNIFPFLSGLGGALTSFVFMLFIAIFFVTEPVNYLEGLLTLVPRSYRPRALEIFQRLGGMLQRWFVGQLISMTMSGIMIAFVTGAILGLPNAVALGVISGLMEFIPNFGSIIAVIPAVVIALAEDPVLVPVVIAAYLIVQQVQSNVIMPRIMSRQISIPAAFILIAQIIGAALFGFMGILLALPMAIYVFDILNSRPAQLQTVRRPDGSTTTLVTTDVFRPEDLTPGQAAIVRAQGRNLFDPGEEAQVVEIITPPSPALEQAARGQQMVWIALLTLTVAQGLALVRSLLTSGKEGASRG